VTMPSTDSWRVSPILGVANVRRSAEYWRDVLGFSLDPDDGIFAPVPTEPEGVYGIVKRGGVWVHFQVRRGAPPPRGDRPPHERDLYLYVNRIDELHADLVARGAKIVQPPTVARYGILELVVEDPDGHRIAFGAILPES
jgi:catechol 2,3-dioxygenase-like lactoylglutathione lyase family enzyme